MPVSKNTWNKGLNSDLSKLKSQQDSYLDAKNIKVMTDEGTSSFAVENVRGNTFNFKLPTVINTYKFDVTGLTGNVTIIIDRINSGDAFTLTNIDQKANIFLTLELNDLIQASTTLYGKQYVRAYYNANYIVIYDFLPQSEIDAGIFGIIVTTSPNVSNLRTNTITNHTILGWGYYNNTVVLISCDYNNNDIDPIGKEGFIWAATYDNATNTIQASDIDGIYLNPDTTLKYAGKLNLSRQHAIYKHLKCRY